jgi:hypothetical protein
MGRATPACGDRGGDPSSRGPPQGDPAKSSLARTGRAGAGDRPRPDASSGGGPRGRGRESSRCGRAPRPLPPASTAVDRELARTRSPAGEGRGRRNRQPDRRRPQASRDRTDARPRALPRKLLVLQATFAHRQRGAAGLLAFVDERHGTRSVRRAPAESKANRLVKRCGGESGRGRAPIAAARAGCDFSRGTLGPRPLFVDPAVRAPARRSGLSAERHRTGSRRRPSTRGCAHRPVHRMWKASRIPRRVRTICPPQGCGSPVDCGKRAAASSLRSAAANRHTCCTS